MLSCIELFATLWTVARQAPLSMAFSRQEYWSGLPCSPPGDLPDPGIEPTSLTSPALAGGFFITSATWEARGDSSGITVSSSLVCSFNKNLRNACFVLSIVTPHSTEGKLRPRSAAQEVPWPHGVGGSPGCCQSPLVRGATGPLL